MALPVNIGDREFQKFVETIGNLVAIRIIAPDGIVVSATDFDIRDLSSSQDSIAAVQSGVWNIGTVTSITNPVSIASGTDLEGAPVTVGTSAVEITFSGTTKSISLQSHPDNVGYIWFGKSNITNSGGNAFGILDPGRAVRIGLDDGSNGIYVISDTAAQTIYKNALL